LKRLAAPLCVFSFGINPQNQQLALSTRHSAIQFPQQSRTEC
jgi:hypothetical protein